MGRLHALGAMARRETPHPESEDATSASAACRNITP